MSEAAIDYRSIIASESERFAELIEAGPLDAAVDGCPGWTVRDLGAHLGDVQRWCTAIVATGQPSDGDHEPAGADLLGWFREGTTGLLAALDAAAPDDECWTLEAGGHGTVSFWFRRQALEVAVHRWDAERAVSGLAAPLDPTLAADVIDEWVNWRVVRNLGREGADLGGLDGDVHIHCTDVPGEWTFEMIDGQLVVVDEHRKSSVAAKGSANDLALFLYHRGDDSGVEVFGDRDLLDRWFTAID